VDTVLTLAVSGLMVGSLYGLVGSTVTTMFRTTGTLSFAHGGFALIAAYSYNGLACGQTVSGGRCTGDAALPPWVSAVLAVLLALATALVVERFVMRPLAGAPPVNRMIASVAVLSLSAGICLQINGPIAKTIPQRGQFLPDGGFRLAGVQVDYQRAIIFVFALVLVAVIVGVFQYTWLGLALRACGQAPDSARLMGVRPHYISQINWAVAGAVSGTAGVLIAPITVVNTGTFAFLMVKVVGACVIGGLVSLPMTLAGGLLIGVLEALTPHYVDRPGTSSVVVAVVVIAAVVINRKRLAVETSRTPISTLRRIGTLDATASLWLDAARQVIVRVPRPLRFVPSLALVAWVTTDNYYASIGLNVLFYTLVVLSLTVMTGLSNQPSLMQAGLVGIGAFALATSVSKGAPFAAGVGVAVGLGAFGGIVAGLVSVWFRRLEFAIITLVLGGMISDYVLADSRLKNNIFAPNAFGVDLLDSKNALLMMGAISIVLFLIVGRLRSSTIGTALRAAADMDDRVGHFAISPFRWEIAAFALSGAIAAFAGCVFLLVSSSVTPLQFGPIVSLTLLVSAVVGGMGSLYGAVVAGIVFGYGPILLANASSDSANAYPAILASSLALILLVRAPEGLSGLFRIAADNLQKIPPKVPGSEFRGYRMRLDRSARPPAATAVPDGIGTQTNSSAPFEPVGAR
jgi:branched-subunit amino acid ABC-type transport system permease component